MSAVGIAAVLDGFEGEREWVGDLVAAVTPFSRGEAYVNGIPTACRTR